MNQLRKIGRPLLHLLLITFSAMSIYVPASQAAIIGTDQALNYTINQQQLSDTRSQLKQMLAQDSVKQQLATLGVDDRDIQSRVDNMSDQELLVMADKMEQLPTGQGIVGLAVFLFLVFLITDILGYTDVFPFVNKH